MKQNKVKTYTVGNSTKIFHLYFHGRVGHADEKLDSERKEFTENVYEGQEAQALAEYARTGSVTETIRKLGYPGKSTLYQWYERKKAGLENRHGCLKSDAVGTAHHCNTPKHSRHPSAELKYTAIQHCFEQGEDVEYVSREIGYSRIYMPVAGNI